jgi:(p)ppGpp synthase/HD superfamily hydrolase
MILKAIKFADRKHRGQFRKKSRKPYIGHPIIVSYLLARFKQSKHFEELVVAAILHDTLEDTNTTFDELVREFGALVASLVLSLTSDEAEIAKIGKNAYLKKKLVGISSYGLVLKLADRLSNVMDCPKPAYVNDTVELMHHLRRKRKLTMPQKNLVKEILRVCSEITSTSVVPVAQS